MLIYLVALTVINAGFLLCIRAMQVRELKQFYDQIGHVHDGGTNILGLGAVLLDAFSDTSKYVVIAVIISIVSAVVYVWALVRPAQWKSYGLLIVGVGLTWVGMAADLPGILVGTVMVIGHLYIVTSVIQFVVATNNPDYFADIVQEKKAVQKRIEDVTSQVSFGLAFKASNDAEFERFLRALDDSEKRLFVGICQALALKNNDFHRSGSETVDTDRLARYTRNCWSELRSRYRLA
jgi:hypothetical protein